MKPLETDILIIGAGPAGCLAAALLQREGFRIHIVEKQAFPRFVIGESMLPCSMNLLAEAGLLDAIEKQNFMRKYGAVFLRGDETCNFDFSNQFGDGYKYTYQVTRADFDQALADTVAARGVEILYRHGVDAVDFSPTHATATVTGPDNEPREIKAKFILDCSGFGRVLPRLLQLERPSNFPNRESLFAHVTGDIRPPAREEGKVWVCMHPSGAWIWIIPFNNGKTSVGIVGDPEFFAKFTGTPEEQLRAIVMSDPNAAKRLANMEIVMPPQHVRGYACAVTSVHGPRFALVGNATEFLDPIFSSGVALALSSAQRAAQVLTRQLRGEPVDWQADYADYVMHGINTFRSYVLAWYDDKLPQIFFTPNKNPDIMRQICSVLAGYVWDKSNPYVTQPDRALTLLTQIIRRQTQAA
jgi:2-polyprenyl-6-methoxyphenol hydroxylase-like FAD-dependent oxidoreductase